MKNLSSCGIVPCRAAGGSGRAARAERTAAHSRNKFPCFCFPFSFSPWTSLFLLVQRLLAALVLPLPPPLLLLLAPPLPSSCGPRSRSTRPRLRPFASRPRSWALPLSAASCRPWRGAAPCALPIPFTTVPRASCSRLSSCPPSPPRGRISQPCPGSRTKAGACSRRYFSSTASSDGRRGSLPPR